jgi:hypothetical protein
MRRRDFLVRSIAGGGALLLGARPSSAQQTHRRRRRGAEQSSGSSNLFDMNQGAAKRVVRPPKTPASGRR